MHTRLLSFLSDFEQALLADDPSPEDGTWQTTRTVNYRNGLARLQLNVKLSAQQTKPRGKVLMQSYNLADGTTCLKANLGWAGTDLTATHSIFSKPGNDWKSAARRLAAEWMAGPPAAPQPAVAENPELNPVMAEAAVV